MTRLKPRRNPRLRPRADWVPDDDSVEYVHIPDTLVFEEDPGEEWSGLYDAHGHKLMRPVGGLNEPIGFVHFPPKEEDE